MSRVIKSRDKSKVKRAQAVNIKSMQEYGQMDVNCKVALIQELIPLGLMHIKELLQDDAGQADS